MSGDAEYPLGAEQFAGPLAVRRYASGGYTLAPRLDLLTADQRGAVCTAARAPGGLTDGQAAVLLTALACGHTPDYAAHRTAAGWEQAEAELNGDGLLHAEFDPDRAEVSEDVLHSLRYHDLPEPSDGPAYPARERP
ncbi:hypothetical protein [Sinosporangium siamense]|uniref:Uncharacterized protein n=1 Tax=Sinosporangium siamense TaxID=1367973 RepID=A0A919RM65_9ACTN|nr:hypothetical protein [Sinosporangium siamense]GII96351.1 hypothetical protein Ssi02_65820 [Sinosporangium siamense]